MRFKSQIRNIQTFTKLTASLSSLGKVAWVRLDNDQVRFTIIPEQGTQVWAVLSIDTIFSPPYTIQSASPNNTINLELPLSPLTRALRSALSASSASLRLTKKDSLPCLSLTITLSSSSTTSGGLSRGGGRLGDDLELADVGVRETIITQDIPVRVLSPGSVEGIHEPRTRAPDVHIYLPSLAQLKTISDRFTKLASTVVSGERSGGPGPKLVIAANNRGGLRLSVASDSLSMTSEWTGLMNPSVEGREREEGFGEDGEWAVVRVDGKDWGRVLGVGRMGGRVIACFCHEHALILYVYLSPEGEEDLGDSVLTYYISSFSA